MSGDKLYKEGCALRDKLEEMTLSELLALNPTLGDMRHVLGVMAIGHGEGADEWHVNEVKKLLGSDIAETCTENPKQKEGCLCKQEVSLRSTHCPFHGTCNCCHGCECPTHDEPEKFVSVAEDFCW